MAKNALGPVRPSIDDTLAQIRWLTKLGASAPFRIVLSTNMPPSSCSTRRVTNVAASFTQGTPKQTSVLPLNAAEVATLRQAAVNPEAAADPGATWQDRCVDSRATWR